MTSPPALGHAAPHARCFARPRSPRRLLLVLVLPAALRASATAQPPPGADLQLVKCEEERPAAAPGPLKLHVVVRNAGAGQSQDATLLVRLIDDAGAFAASAAARLDNGAIDPGVEQAFLVTIADAPAFRRIVPALVWTTGFVSMAGADFTNEPRLEVGQCLFRRCSNGDLLVTGKVRNGRAAPAGELAITFAFADRTGREVKSASRRLAGAIPPGAAASFLWRIPECPPIETFTASIDGRELAASPAEPFDPERNAREEGLPATAVRGRLAVVAPPADAGAPALPKPDAPPTPAPPAAPYGIFVDGLEWIGGTYRPAGGTRNLKYSGDTAFLKLRFTDAQNGPAQPEATVIVRVSDKNRDRGFCKRKVTKTAWKLDAEKITGENAAPEIVAFHAKEGALWVGLVTAENSAEVELALDVSVEIPKAGTWTWKGLRDPFRTALAPPEPKKR